MDRSRWGKETPDEIASIDFETYFDKKETSLSKMNVWEYVFHPKTFPYMMSVKTSMFEWCGDPREFAMWDLFDGKVVCAHNASFDGLIWKRLERDGVVPKDCKPRRWVCTADLAAYLRVRRNLQSVAKELYGEEISKQERSDAEGKTADDMKADGTWDAMVKYGLHDALWCYRVARDHLKDWPAVDQFISEQNREESWRGFSVDVEAIRGDSGALESLKTKVFQYRKDIPWYPDESELSPIALRKQAREEGIKVPASLAKSDDAAQKFFAEYSAKVPWVAAVRNFRQANMMLKKVETLDRGTRDDGTFPYTSVYYGANTGRFTAGTGGNNEDSGGKFNLFNLPRGELQGVDLRGLIVPRKGFKFFVGDYSQIEFRLLLWRSGDEETLSMIRDQGYHPYEAMAETVLDVPDAKGLKKKDAKLYSMSKGFSLGCGYQMGGPRFFVQAPILTANDEHPELVYRPTLAEAAAAVALFREKKPKIVNYWHRHQTFLLSSVYNGDPTHSVELASGRWLTYFDPTFALTVDEKTGRERKEIVVRQIRGEPHKRIYGGKLTENEMQATGYDILRDAWAAIADRCREKDDGSRVVWTLYDEFVAEVPEKTAEEDGAELAHLMVSSSPWTKGLPLDADWKIADRYFK